MSDSKLNMFRCVIAMAQKDGVINKGEYEELSKILANVKFSPEQQQALSDEITRPIDINEVLPKVTDKPDRAMLAHYARIMMHADGDPKPDEQALIKRLEEFAISNADSVDIVSEYQMAYEDFERKSDEDIYKSKSKSFLFKRFLDWMDN